MTIYLYNNSSEARVMRKELAGRVSFTGTLKGDCSIIDPVISIEGSVDSTKNYMYIVEFGRYYYITGVTQNYNSLYTISGHCDVLMTYADSIKKCDCIVSRNEYKRTELLIDDELWATADSLYGVQEFPESPFTGLLGRNYVMLLAGAGSIDPETGDFSGSSGKF